MVNPVMGLCFVPWSTVHLAVSPYNFVHLNCSSWVRTTDLLTSWGGERQSEKEEENVLVESLDHKVGSSHPPVLNPLPATQKNPGLKRRRLPGSWFKEKQEMWIWMMFCVSFLAAHQEPKNHFIPGKQWLFLVASPGLQQRWEDVCTQPSLGGGRGGGGGRYVLRCVDAGSPSRGFFQWHSSLCTGYPHSFPICTNFIPHPLMSERIHNIMPTYCSPFFPLTTSKCLYQLIWG